MMNKPNVRTWISAILTVIIMGVFIARLMDIQIVEADSYKKVIGENNLYKQVINATRGEIVDASGNPLAVNRMCYDVIIDKTAFPSARANEIILNLIGLFKEFDEQWSDVLPITSSAPFTFLPNREDDVNRLKKFLEMSDYGTAEDALYWLNLRYGTEEYSPADARAIVGVRYGMTRQGFNYEVPYTFAKDIDKSSIIKIKEQSYMLSGVDIIESTVRVHPAGDLAPHLIGLVGQIPEEESQELIKKGYALNDLVGQSGSERAFEEILRGTDGNREVFCDANGQVIQAIESKPPVPGNTVALTLRENMQRMAQDSLARQIKNLQDTAKEGEGKEANRGAAAVVECKTGKILALATYPSYNINRYYEDYSLLVNDAELRPLYNNALLGLYAPGSCFKPAVATAGFSAGIIDSHSTFVCNQVMHLPGSTQRFTCLGLHGNISLTNALRWSCNIFFYNTGYNAGIDKVDQIARQYGLGEYTGIELRENKGFRSNPETKMTVEGVEWYPGDVLQSSIGQLHHQFTPLQLANYAATIGNRGTRMKLSIVEEIRDYSMQNIVAPFVPVVADRVDAPPEAFEAVIQGMVAASRPGGTAAAQFGNYPIDVASKTGTPESATLPNSTFICFAPADDPVIAIAVVIENGWHGYTGAPVAKDILNEYFGYGVPQPATPASLSVPAAEADNLDNQSMESTESAD